MRQRQPILASSRPARPGRRGRCAFTLVELLVVVAILSLLISILMPSLQRARMLTVRTLCATRVRAILSGSFSYASENRDFFPHRPPGSYQPHTIFVNNLFDLHTTFVAKYVPSPVRREISSAGKVYEVLDADSAMYCPGPLRQVRGPEVPGWNVLGGYAYTYSSYTYYNFKPTYGSVLLSGGQMPNLRHSNADSRYPLWSCLTVNKTYAWLGHDVPERPIEPSGMSAAFVSGATGWVEWPQCQRYWNDTSQDFWWPTPGQ